MRKEQKNYIYHILINGTRNKSEQETPVKYLAI
jgi:hypothetical protein